LRQLWIDPRGGEFRFAARQFVLQFALDGILADRDLADLAPGNKLFVRGESSLEVQPRQLSMGVKVDLPQIMMSASLPNTLIPINATSANPGILPTGSSKNFAKLVADPWVNAFPR
jgi:hypothetical protein